MENPVELSPANPLPEPRNRAAPLYEGLPVPAKLLIILLGLAGGVAAITVSSIQAVRLQQNLGYSQPDVDLLKNISAEGAQKGVTPLAFVVHALNIQTHLKGITNRQAIGVLTIGTGIALFAIGFALFIIGVDGAFKVHLEARQDAKIVLYGSTPGLLCFLLGALVIAMAGFSTRYELNLGTFSEQPTKKDAGSHNKDSKTIEELHHELNPDPN